MPADVGSSSSSRANKSAGSSSSAAASSSKAGSSKGKPASNKRQLSKHERRIYKFISQHGAATPAEVEKAFPKLTEEVIAETINTLSRMSLVRVRGTGSDLTYEPVTKEEATMLAELEGNERIVYSHIRDAGNEGIWTKTIKNRANMNQIVVNRCLKTLEQKQIIKTVKNVKFPTRKIVMLYNLEPSTELSGGPWYSDTELDEAFIEAVSQLCLSFISKKTWPDEGSSRLLYPASHVYSLPTASEILEYSNASGVYTTPLSLEHIQQLLDTLIYDEKIEKIAILPGRRRVQKTSEASSRKTTRRSTSRGRKRSSRDRSDSDSGSESASEDEDGTGDGSSMSDDEDDDRGHRRKHKHRNSSSRSRSRSKSRSSKRKHSRRRHRSDDEDESGSGSDDDSASESGSSSSSVDSRRSKRKGKRKRSSSSSSSRKKRRRHRSVTPSSTSSEEDREQLKDGDSSSDSDPMMLGASDDEDADPNYEAADALPFVYRALRPLRVFPPFQTELPLQKDGEYGTGTSSSSWMQTPCGVCPVLRFCQPGGPVNAEECVYWDAWIDAELKGNRVEAEYEGEDEANGGGDDAEDGEDEDMNHDVDAKGHGHSNGTI